MLYSCTRMATMGVKGVYRRSLTPGHHVRYKQER